MPWLEYWSAVFFWISFSLTPGPFWITWVNYHTQKNTLGIYKKFLLYLFSTFFFLNFLLCYLVLNINHWTNFSLPLLYFLGASFIIYLALKSFYSQIKKIKTSFSFWEMTLITLTNPKFYLTAPAGCLSMLKIENLIWVKSLIFSLMIMPPVVLLGSFFFLGLAKLGQKIFINKVRYLTSSLLLGYGIYLFYEGVILLHPLSPV